VSSLVLTLRETLRYRGAIGQWSWVLHRLSGLGVLLFFVIHVVDTSWSVFYPALYEKAIAIYQTPLFTLGEFALVAAVVYHAYNGLRIVVLDYKPEWWRFQERAAVWVLALSALTLLPVFLLMFTHVLHYYEDSPAQIGLGQVLVEQIPFVVGIGGAFVAALLFSAVAGLFTGGTEKATAGTVRKGRGSKLERFWWSYMRISGLLIVPLVFGHLAAMHVVQGVFDLTVAGKPIVGVSATDGTLLTNAINDTGTAVEFVGERWNYLVASVAVWRFYDFALLALAAIHGFNGLRYVLTDYTMDNPLLRRASVYVSVIGVAVMLLVGGGALIGTIEETAVREAERARVNELEIGFRSVDDFESEFDTCAAGTLSCAEDAEANSGTDAEDSQTVDDAASDEATNTDESANSESSDSDE
jgi:succinate dehydrogenase / fumarate reductase, cytochrome b subunit